MGKREMKNKRAKSVILYNSYRFKGQKLDKDVIAMANISRGTFYKIIKELEESNKEKKIKKEDFFSEEFEMLLDKYNKKLISKEYIANSLNISMQELNSAIRRYNCKEDLGMTSRARPTVLLKNNNKSEKAEKDRRIKQEETLKIEDDKVYCPPIDLDEEDRSIYKEIVEELRSSKVLCNLDTEMIIITVDSLVNMRKSKGLIADHGLLLEKNDGTVYKNPAINVYKDYNSIYNKCCLELGLSPSARARLAGLNNASVDDDDELKKILKRK